MTKIEAVCRWIRHSSRLQRMNLFWNLVRPLHDFCWRVLAWRGISRIINGSDAMRISPRLRCMGDTCEPEVWRSLMGEVKVGDVFVDVGAYHGLYSIAVGKRVGRSGRVYSFEPDPEPFEMLQENVNLNGLQDIVTVEKKAVATACGVMFFDSGLHSASHLNLAGTSGIQVPVVALQDYLQDRRMDLLKIDVEGFEQAVLAGTVQLLNDIRRRPRAIYIEMHPFAWQQSGTTSSGVLSLLDAAGYGLFSLDGQSVTEVTCYSEVIARPLI